MLDNYATSLQLELNACDGDAAAAAVAAAAVTAKIRLTLRLVTWCSESASSWQAVSRVLTDRADVLNNIAVVFCCQVFFSSWGRF